MDGLSRTGRSKRPHNLMVEPHGWVDFALLQGSPAMLASNSPALDHAGCRIPVSLVTVSQCNCPESSELPG